jgi:hypothetical protein
LRVAANSGAIRAVHEVALYRRADLFSGFVKHFFAAKQAAVKAGNQADAMIFKMMLNSLQGKFAQKGRMWSPAPHILSKGGYAYWWQIVSHAPGAVRCRSIAGKCEQRVVGPEPRHAMPAIAACITANARVRLDKDIKTAGIQDVLYCDTDSVHTNVHGRDRLDALGRLHPHELGKLRELHAGDNAYYWGRQHYRVGDKFCCSSLKPDAVEVSDGVYLQDAVTGVERSLETGLLDRVAVAKRTINMNARSCDAVNAYRPA